MKTTATNRKIHQLLTALREKRLIPRPEFQRRLVWTNKDKSSFLETVLMNYPFPEIYLSTGEVDVDTGQGIELLVDGQQRVTTLYQYFTGSPDIRLGPDVTPYKDLEQQMKEAFLQYDVVVRDLGQIDVDTTRRVFQRINATGYSLNAMEIHNARYEGAFKGFAETFAQQPFFEQHRIFSPAEIRRMQDIRFVVVLLATILGTYFNRDDEIEEYLRRYNDEFPMETDIAKELQHILSFVEKMDVSPQSRIWKKADLFTCLVELHRAIVKKGLSIEPTATAELLNDFFATVDDPDERVENVDAEVYYKAALQASNDRGNRIARGEIMAAILAGGGQIE